MGNSEKDEGELVRDALSAETGVHFELITPHPGFPLSPDRVEWFMRCRRREEIQAVPYVNAAWKERGDGTWLESLAVGDTVEWVQLAYGEDLAAGSLDLDYSRFDEPGFQEEFGRRFPTVMERVRSYDALAAEVSKRHHVHVELRRAGSRGILVFTVAALVRAGASDVALRRSVARSVGAMKEAYGAMKA